MTKEWIKRLNQIAEETKCEMDLVDEKLKLKMIEANCAVYRLIGFCESISPNDLTND